MTIMMRIYLLEALNPIFNSFAAFLSYCFCSSVINLVCWLLFFCQLI